MYDEVLFSSLADIVNGYSLCRIGNRDIFAKHLDLKSELKAAATYERLFEKFKKEGVPTRAERLLFLKEEGDWKEEDEAFIFKNQKFLDGLERTKGKLIVSSQVEEIKRNISEVKQQLSQKIFERELLIGATCEKYASKRKEEAQILSSMFLNEELSIPMFSQGEEEYLEQNEIDRIFEAYFSVFKRFEDEKLKRLAVSPLFYNFASLVPKENPSLVFGKSALDLTFFQQKILHYTQNLRYIYENTEEIPAEIKDNYDAIVDFSKKERSRETRKSSAVYSVVGASKKEMEMSGIKTDGAVSPFQLLRKSGKKTLEKRDFINAMQ